MQQFTNLSTWKWWIGFTLGSLIGAMALVILRMPITGGKEALSALTSAPVLSLAGKIGLTQTVFSRIAYSLWKLLDNNSGSPRGMTGLT